MSTQYLTQPCGSAWHSRHEYPKTHIPAPEELSGKKAATIHWSMTGCQSPKLRQPKNVGKPHAYKTHDPTTPKHHPRTRTKPPPQRRLPTSLLPWKKPSAEISQQNTRFAPVGALQKCSVLCLDGPADSQKSGGKKNRGTNCWAKSTPKTDVWGHVLTSGGHVPILPLPT